MAWAVFTPIVLMLAFTLVFTKFGHVATDGIPYPLFAYIGLIPWSFFSASVLTGGMSLSTNLPLAEQAVLPARGLPARADRGRGRRRARLDRSCSSCCFRSRAATPTWQTRLRADHACDPLRLHPGRHACDLGDRRLHARPADRAAARHPTRPLRHPGRVRRRAPIASSRTGLILYSALNPLVPVIDGLRRTVLLGQSPDWASALGGGGLGSGRARPAASCCSSASRRDSQTLREGTIATTEVWKRFRTDNRPTYLSGSAGPRRRPDPRQAELRLALGAPRDRVPGAIRASRGA